VIAPHTRDLIVVGASAGGVEALRGFAAGLPADLAASVLVVLHLPAGGTSALAAILGRSGPLPAVRAAESMDLERGTIYTAPPDRHLVVVDGTLALPAGPTENGRRPAIDALFRSAAIVAGPRVTGVLLSGVLDDGVAGLVAIASRGGKVMVQDPDEALFPSMPNHALQALPVDHVLGAGAMGAVLDKLSREDVAPEDALAPSRLLHLENEIATTSASAQTGRDPERLGRIAGFTCPDCDGPLVELAPGMRYRCRIGHGWTAKALLDTQGSACERALWSAVRTLDEKAALCRRMAGQARERGGIDVARRYYQMADESLRAAARLREPAEAADAGRPEETG
jgi:two-component system chemotaxis response regulator CheB